MEMNPLNTGQKPGTNTRCFAYHETTTYNTETLPAGRLHSASLVDAPTTYL